ncbi:integrase core domain-containing protein [Deinococcus hopiensis]|uniref:integrase core domain-containing protein n=1 Tax=Deinococcus hopiensis TaxID=309885 RepID=UPI003CCBB51C
MSPARRSRLRDELLNLEVFRSPRHAQVLLDGWRTFYNSARPLSSLTSDEFAQRWGGPTAPPRGVHSP